MAKAGQPTLYKPEYCDMLIEHFKDGNSYAAFAAILRVSRETLYAWERQNSEFSDAKKIGWGHYQAWWENEGKKGMYEQILINEDGSKSILKMNAAIWVQDKRY